MLVLSVVRNFSKNIPNFCRIFNEKTCILKPLNCVISQERGIRKSYAMILRVMKLRRKLVGPERVRRRNEWPEWNYHSELYAFAQRLQEELTQDTLKTVFTTQTYIDDEERRRKELEIPVQDVKVNLIANTHLASTGHDVMSRYIKAFLRYGYAALPEDGICAIHDYLMSNEILAHVSSNIGTKDLILTPEYPPDESSFVITLKALIGAIASENSVKRAEHFVLDFICPQLIGKDIFDIWDFPNPLSVLDSILKRHGWAPYESRLTFESGRNTMESIYQVAIFSDKVFLGHGPGETLAIAEEMAAYDALRRLFKLQLNCDPLPFGNKGRELNLQYDVKHPLLTEWYSEEFEKQKVAVS